VHAVVCLGYTVLADTYSGSSYTPDAVCIVCCNVILICKDVSDIFLQCVTGSKKVGAGSGKSAEHRRTSHMSSEVRRMVESDQVRFV